MKHTLFAAAAISMSLFAHNALAGQTCAYVIGDIDGELVTTAAVLLSVPPGSVDVDPIVVHVDETDQTIAGYSFHVPGVDEGWDPDEIFVPGAEAASSAMVETLAELDLDLMFCLEGSRTTPAIPIYIPASELTAPGAFTNVPAIHFDLLGREWSLPGQMLLTEKHTIIIPAFSAVIPPRHQEVPDGTIGVELDGELEIINHLSASN